LALVPLVLLLAGCKSSSENQQAANHQFIAPFVDYPTMGKIERFDPGLDYLIPVNAKIEKLAQGFDWSEGPVWVANGAYVLFSDVPQNIVYKWTEGSGLAEYLKPSGYTGPVVEDREPGSNGLALDCQGRLVLCQHGDRRVSRLGDDGAFLAIASNYLGYKFNSPNDLAFKSGGDIYFTDPPYGLTGLNESPKKERMYNGVFRVAPCGTVTLLTDELTFPNGIAFSPDET
jgi:gluconolactonase